MFIILIHREVACMKQVSALTINRENFSQCWDYIDKLRRKARVKSAIAAFGGSVSNLFLLFSMISASK